MDGSCLILLISACFIQAEAVRLHKLFQYLDGYKSSHNLRGYLHVGSDYAVFLKLPKPHDRFLVYELYESRNIPDKGKYSPRLLAVSKIPVEYVREQLKIYRDEIYRSKYKDDNVVPGTQVKTLREWQIEKALELSNDGRSFDSRALVLRTVF